MSYKPVTTPQLEQVRKMAIEKGIDRARFQKYGLDSGLIALALDAVKEGCPIVIDLPPAGTIRTHTITVEVELDQPWEQAIAAVNPKTPSDYPVHEAGEIFRPTGVGVVLEELVLLNYPAGDGSFKKALMWAEQNELKTTSPRHVFAMGLQCPNFHRDSKVNPSRVVATEVGDPAEDPKLALVWWRRNRRTPTLDRAIEYLGLSDCWFAFRK